MTTTIKPGDRVQWLHTFLYGAQRTRSGKVLTITGAHAYVRTRRSGKPVLVSLDRLTKVQPPEDEAAP